MSITAFETPEKDGLHLCDDLTLFEFIDNNNKPVKDGETGRIVLTNLVGFTIPFIRYDHGDLAKIKITKDKNGRSIIRISKIVGRNTDIIYLPNDRRLYVLDFDNIMYGFEGIMQFRVIQKSKNYFHLNIATTS